MIISSEDYANNRILLTIIKLQMISRPRLLLNVNSLCVFRTLKTIMQPKPARDYQGAIKVLNSLQSNAYYIKNSGTPKATTNIVEVTKFLGRSGISLEKLDQLSVIHIAGTNGKGTTCAYCESILRNHGYKTGFYSSPHLLDVRERIRINGKPISKKDFARNFWKIYDLLDQQKAHSDDIPYYFRYLTVLAFHIFLEEKVDVAIIEVGIGGEYDCTNVVRKTAVAGITSLDLDHTSMLGNSMESIAWNKGGIMKEGSIAFSAEQPEAALKVLQSRSVERKCTFQVIKNNFFTGNNSTMPSHIQKMNANLALAISEAYIKITSDHKFPKTFSLELAKHSIEKAFWPGRYEIRELNSVRYYIDGAHTLQSISICTQWFKNKTANCSTKKALIFNLIGNRDAEGFLNILSKCNFSTVIFTPNVGSDNDRADITDFILTENLQLKQCEAYKNLWLTLVEEKSESKAESVRVVSSFSEAINLLENDNVKYDALVTGSIHLVGAALSILDPTLNGILSD